MIWERTQEGKMAKRAKDPNYKEGRKTIEKPDNYEWYLDAVKAGEMQVIDACAEIGISRSLWYKWLKETA
jgi:hypothetical protein